MSPVRALLQVKRKMMDQKQNAKKLRKHLQSGPAFILPQVWDVASARVIADSGFDYIATSAVAIGWANGYQPQERIPPEQLLSIASRIAGGSQTPVIADLGGALDRTPEDIARNVHGALEAGCVGVTISDGSRNGAHGMVDMEAMADSLRAARAATLEARIPAVITASTDAFLLGPAVGSPFESAVERAEMYFAAGADCMFVPGVQQLQIVERLAAIVDAPLAISIEISTAPDLAAFADAGVACVMLGSGLMRSLLGMMRHKAEELRAFGSFSQLERAIPTDELEALLR